MTISRTRAEIAAMGAITEPLPAGTNTIGKVKEDLPSTVLDGSKTNIGTAGAALGGSVTINKGILVICDSLGTGGTYIAFGNAAGQSAKYLKNVGDNLWIDWSNNLASIYVKGDNTGNNGSVSFNGG